MHMRRLSVILLLAILLLAAVGPVLAQGGGENDPPPTPFWDENDDPEFNAQMDRVEQATAILRDLEPLQSVTRAFLTRDDLLAYLEDTLDTDYPPDVARDDALFYAAFGFMSPDIDLRQLQLDLLAEQIGGFYDPELDAMFVISATEELGATNQALYAHEFTHVLQDQYYDLTALGIDDETAHTEPDRLLALQGLIEGDAMLITEGYQTWLTRNNPGIAFSMLGEALTIRTEVLFSVPAIMRSELTFPYTEGRNFTYQLFVAGDGWGLLNDAYSNPPQSSEQVIHPERYVAGDAPIPVSVAALDEALGEGWREVWHRTLGEFYLREHLRLWLPEETADSAAEGWGGDSYRLYVQEESGQTVLVWRTVWDSPEDAAEFAAAYRGLGALRYDDPGIPTDDQTVCWYGEAETTCQRTGPNETLIFSVPERGMVADILPLLAPVR